MNLQVVGRQNPQNQPKTFLLNFKGLWGMIDPEPYILNPKP